MAFYFPKVWKISIDGFLMSHEGASIGFRSVEVIP